MTITYHAGRRIQGLAPLSADTTNTQVTASNGVVSFDITTRTTNQAVTYDIGSNLSDSAWVMRAKLDYVAITGGSGSTAYLELGVGSASSSTAFANGGITQDFIGLQQRKASDADGWGLVGYNSTGGLDNPESPLMDAVPNTSTTYYVEIKRLTSTSMSIGLYTTSSYGTLISGIALETKTNVPSGVTGLRYIRVGNAGMISETAGNVIEGTFTIETDFVLLPANTSAVINTTNMVDRINTMPSMSYYNSPSVTFEDDFTSSPNGWTLGSGQTIETTGGSGTPSTIGYLYADGNDVLSSKPLAIGEPTNFIFDFDYAPVDGAPRITFMILNSEIGGYGAASSGHKKILFSMHQNGVMVDIRYRISGQSEVEVNAIDSVIPAYDGTISYYRMIKTSGNVTVKRYASDANRTSDTSSTDISLNFTEAGYSGTADLAYLVVGGAGSTSGYSRNAKLYDFKFYSGVTSLDNVWSEEGT